MAEYDLVCDACRRNLEPAEGVICWTTVDNRESDHMLVHTTCAPASATNGIELRLAMQPALLFGFVSDRIGREIADPAALKAIMWAIVPFVIRPDSAAEMMMLRAKTFSSTFGEKPVEIKRRLLPGHPPMDQFLDEKGAGKRTGIPSAADAPQAAPPANVIGSD